MSKEAALNFATQGQVSTPEVRPSIVTGAVPEKVMEAANPAVAEGAIPQPLVSTQLSHLAKKEAKLIAEREAFKKEQEEFQALKSKVQDVYNKAEAFESTRKQDPIKALRDLGFTEKEIVDYLSQEEAPALSTEQIVQAELQKFKDEEAKKISEAQAKRDQGLVQQFRSQLTEAVKADPEKFELCAYHGPLAEEIMFEIAVAEAKEGKVPDVHSIAEEVEEFYTQQFQAMSKLKKLTPQQQAVLDSKQPERSRVVHPPQETVKPQPKTLTNKMAVTSAALASPRHKIESRDEKRARLEALIRTHGLTK